MDRVGRHARGRSRATRWIAAALVAATVVAACGDDDDGGGASPTTTAAATPETTAATEETTAATSAPETTAAAPETTAATETTAAAPEDIAGTPEPKPLASRETIRVTLPLYLEAFAPYILADHFGEFDKENLDVEVSVMLGSEALVLLGSGDIDAIFGTPNAGFFNAIDAGVDVRWIAPNITPSPESLSGLWVRNDALGDDGTATADEVRNWKFSIGNLGFAAPAAQVVADYLEPLGLTLNDIENVVIQNGPDMIAALENDAIQAGVFNDPFNKVIRDSGIATLVQKYRGAPEYPGYTVGGILAERIREERPEVLDAFIRALMRTIRTHLQGDYHINPEVVTALAEAIGVDEATIQGNEQLIFDPEMQLDPTAATDLQEMWIAVEVLPYDEPYPVDQVIDLSSVERVRGEL